MRHKKRGRGAADIARAIQDPDEGRMETERNAVNLLNHWKVKITR
jgi:translation initiation factor IF-2